MIIGNGMMAQAFSTFRDDPRVLIFASGISDSLESRAEAFVREKSLLTRAREEHAEKLLVYFGTCSVDDPGRACTPYVEHKLHMETLLKLSPHPWMVLRLPLAIGPGRRGTTLAPFLYDRISRGETFEVWEHATRYLVDVADALRIAARFIRAPELWNRRINVALRAFPVLEFVRVMEGILRRRAVYTLVPKGRHYQIRCPEVAAVSGKLNIDRSNRYLERVLDKYFG